MLRGQLYRGRPGELGNPRRLDAHAALRHRARSADDRSGPLLQLARFRRRGPGDRARARNRLHGALSRLRVGGGRALRGIFTFVDFYLIADWLAPVFPSANYVTSGDSFYLLRAASPLVAALLLVRFLPARVPARQAPARTSAPAFPA